MKHSFLSQTGISFKNETLVHPQNSIEAKKEAFLCH